MRRGASTLLLVGAVLVAIPTCRATSGVNASDQTMPCGNGVLDEGEECDDGAGNSDESPDACRLDCSNSRCGDGVVDAGETCDSGGEVGKGCNLDCTASRCGDGIVNAATGETCDTGGESIWCNANCTPVACGDGISNRTAGECDDGVVFTHGRCDRCRVVCDPGFGDCNGDLGDGCEQSLLDDPANCGTCRHDCLGSPCHEDLCDQTEVASFGSIVGEVAWDSLAIAAEYLYWTRSVDGRILRAKKDGAKQTPELVLAGQENSISFVLGDGTLFWASPSPQVPGLNSIFAFTPGVDSARRSVGDNLGRPYGLAYGHGKLVWADYGTVGGGFVDGRVLQVSSASGERAELAVGLDRPFGVSTDGTTTYVLGRGSLGRLYSDGYIALAAKDGLLIIAKNQPNLAQLTQDDRAVYWTVQGPNPNGPLNEGAVMRFAPGYDRSPRALADRLPGAGALATDGSNVYWAMSGGVYYTRRDGSDTPHRLQTAVGGAVSIAIDGSYLYYLSGGGYVFRIPK